MSTYTPEGFLGKDSTFIACRSCTAVADGWDGGEEEDPLEEVPDEEEEEDDEKDPLVAEIEGTSVADKMDPIAEDATMTPSSLEVSMSQSSLVSLVAVSIVSSVFF